MKARSIGDKDTTIQTNEIPIFTVSDESAKKIRERVELYQQVKNAVGAYETLGETLGSCLSPEGNIALIKLLVNYIKILEKD